MTIAQEFAIRNKEQKKRALIIRFVPVILLLLLIIVFGIITPAFLSFENLYVNILDQLSIILVLTVGITFVIIMGGIDLSIDGVMGFAGCFIGLLVLNTKTAMNLGLLGIIITIAVCGAIGALSGLLHIKLKLPTFIVTFAMGYIASGLGVLTYRGIPATILDEGLRGLYFNKILGIPYLTWIAFAVFLIALFIEKKTSFGRYIFAIGDNEKVPLMSGINVSRIKVMAFVWAGICLGIAGIMGAAKLGTAQIYIGRGNLFPALTAVVVGGTSMSGGEGGILNSLIGALIVTILQNGMVMIGVAPEVQQGIQGAIIIAAVVLSINRKRKNIVK